MRSGLPICDECRRDAVRVHAIYFSNPDGKRLLIGMLGRKCYLKAARAAARLGLALERENGRPVRLRGPRR